MSEKTFAGAVHQAELLAGVEGEGGDVNLFHDFAEKCGGFQRAESLIAKSGGHGVDLLHDFAERLFGIVDSGADAVIAFAQSFEQIR